MRRTVFRLLDLAIAVALSLAIASVGRVRAAEWPHASLHDNPPTATSLNGLLDGNERFPGLIAKSE